MAYFSYYHIKKLLRITVGVQIIIPWRCWHSNPDPGNLLCYMFMLYVIKNFAYVIKGISLMMRKWWLSEWAQYNHTNPWMHQREAKLPETWGRSGETEEKGDPPYEKCSFLSCWDFLVKAPTTHKTYDQCICTFLSCWHSFYHEALGHELYGRWEKCITLSSPRRITLREWKQMS